MRVRVGETYHVVFYAPFYVAHRLGLFERQGIQLEVDVYGASTALSGAMDRGDVDIGIGGIMRSLVAFNRGEPAVPVHFARINDRDGFLLLGHEPKFDWPDLLDKRLIVFAEAPTPWQVMRSLLAGKGLDPDRVHAVADVPLGRIAAAFRDGAADFVLTQAHVAEELLRGGDALLLRSMAEEAGALPYSSYFCRSDYLTRNEESLRPFVRAHVDALNWIAQHDGAEVWDVIAPAFAGEDQALLRTATERYHAAGTWSSDSTLPRASYQALAQALQRGGLIQRVAPYELVCSDLLAREAEARFGQRRWTDAR